MVRDAHLAEDVTQGVFVALAQNARQLTDRPVLSGWLHRTAQNIAAQTVRTEVRRRAREQEAAAMNELLAPEPDATWEHIAPHLDAALGELSEADRDALLLRYFERKSAREMAQTLGTSEDAAQKRVSRAVERLRKFFAKHGITVGASGLAVVISAHAVQAAPIGLSATITTAAVLAGTVVQTSTAIAATKAIAMTTLQKTIIGATLAVAVGAGIYEARQVSRLREENQTLQQQQTPLTGQIEQLRRQHDDATNRLAASQQENEQLHRETAELAKLRGEVGRLRAAARELAQWKAAGAGVANDPSLATIQAWTARTTLLKTKLAEMPDKSIPELQFLTEKDWADAAKDADLNTGDGVRQALSELRGAAKNTFMDLMQAALNKYVQASNGVLPSDLAQLQPFMATPSDEALLRRYQLVQTGKLSDDPSKPVVTEIAPPVDEEYDSHIQITMNGRMVANRVSTIGDAIGEAAREFARNNNGRLPREASQIAPYLKRPIDDTTLEKYLSQMPADATLPGKQ